MALSHPRPVAALQALVVCFIWSTSFIITKRLYDDGIGPVSLTGIRYTLAGLALAPVWMWRRHACPGRRRPAGLGWWVLVAVGVAGYAVNPLGYNLALAALPASWVGVALGANNTLQVVVFGAMLLRERPTPVQLTAIIVAITGTLAFTPPSSALAASMVLPSLAIVLSGAGYALWVVGNRALLRTTDAIELVCPSMLAGALPVLMIGVGIEGLPRLSASAWLLIGALALINTSLAFLVWTHTQRQLAAHESAVINNTMTIQIAVLASVLLGESLTTWQWLLIGVVANATVVVQTTGSRGHHGA